MNSAKKSRQQLGFSLVELLLAIGLLAVFINLSLIFSDSLQRSLRISRTTSTRDRILAGVRNIAGMPTALRASTRAAQANGTPVNPDLYNCVASVLINACQTNQEYPLTLFSPVVALDATGNPLGLLPIASPAGASTNMHFDSFGVPCATVSADCPFTVSTSFLPQCPPNTLPATPPATSDPAYLSLLAPMPTCTIAETINVIYTVQVDPIALAANPELAVFSTPFSGSVTTSVKLIFGNDPR